MSRFLDFHWVDNPVFSIKFDTRNKSGLSKVYIEGSKVIKSKTDCTCILFSKD